MRRVSGIFHDLKLFHFKLQKFRVSRFPTTYISFKVKFVWSPHNSTTYLWYLILFHPTELWIIHQKCVASITLIFIEYIFYCIDSHYLCVKLSDLLLDSQRFPTVWFAKVPYCLIRKGSLLFDSQKFPTAWFPNVPYCLIPKGSLDVWSHFSLTPSTVPWLTQSRQCWAMSQST